ncbi:MAG: bifunctional folylpolyglutamate synthase/dihydrofolate synthase [Prosthecochloris sp.]|uniref:bifunctional folylpolyglutamate synthase/dihydrofolate synthase n=1 Tax=Prosthecochloris sp. TaxID=290513 RepID=UPI0013C9FC9D|nr:folylpolyglutamate synthase/dihydrofolate synthase family protein [Prosthecochloris sp.]NEX12412.1 bifunctional folylpolyglutamate synthase/dihydrofolate synthase [Prosthecochloris sp.]
MNYRQAIDFLFPLHRFGMKPGLERVLELLRSVGDPHRRLGLVIHIAGTNGKGTVASAVAAIFQASGKRVGLYSSPHLLSFTERIRINGTPIPEDRVAHYTTELVEPITRLKATFFEATTVIAMRYFSEEQVDVAVVETGMGGRLDATNVVSSRYVVIPSISLDHTDWLGPTVDRIAAEKAAIIKPSGVVFTAVEDPSAQRPITERARLVGADLHYLDGEVSIDVHSEEIGRLDFSVRTADREYRHLEAPVSGAFHASNLALAVCVAEHAGVTALSIRNGLAALNQTGYRARMELITSSPKLVLDVSHNPAGIAMSVDVLLRLSRGCSKRFVIFGLAEDKNAVDIIACLGRFSSNLFVVNLPVERGMPSETLAGLCRSAGIAATLCDDFRDAYRKVLEKAAAEDLILVTGSFYLAGEVLQVLQ